MSDFAPNKKNIVAFQDEMGKMAEKKFGDFEKISDTKTLGADEMTIWNELKKIWSGETIDQQAVHDLARKTRDLGSNANSKGEFYGAVNNELSFLMYSDATEDAEALETRKGLV